MNQEKLEKYIQKKAQDIVKYVSKKSHFFKNYYEDYNLDDVWNLPTVNKQIMMDNLTDYNTVGLKKQELLDFCLNIEETQNYEENDQTPAKSTPVLTARPYQP